ncbi:dephospho-CoA kinase [Pseudonocardia bannensis]|uniref:Dephospho-CoA kinase n=1 Tax=Pseudonocardia bannensis TaxID=630973 RepID=A0A848DIY1_9PSEU|nr:dephospho-CoA kinase [Pseudonocardia bannensis]NMH92503.1 dephospho-CoA kinase [Pseudonocardia bannensis]
MLRVGLTGGIGSGKSTVARRLVEHGAVLVDSDALAREVVAAGSEGLAEIVGTFGPELVGPDGELDRPRMASVVFGDPAARDRLNAIVHPRVRRRSDELIATAPDDAIVVQDIPLLVEGRMSPAFPLVVVVHADAEERVRRLVGSRGMPEDDARARLAAQADDADRRAAADVILDNSGTPAELEAAVDELWARRLVPFEENLRLRRTVRSGSPRLVDPDPEWPAQAARLAARIALVAGDRGLGVEHVGSTAVPGLPAKDVIDLQLAVRSLDDADALAGALGEAGFPARPDIDRDRPKPVDPDPEHWAKRFHGGADPGRLVHLHIREAGSAGWRYALLLRDWLRADAGACAEYLAMKRRAERECADDPDPERYAEMKEPWFDAALPRAERWAESSGWRPPLA